MSMATETQNYTEPFTEPTKGSSLRNAIKSVSIVCENLCFCGNQMFFIKRQHLTDM